MKTKPQRQHVLSRDAPNSREEGEGDERQAYRRKSWRTRPSAQKQQQQQKKKMTNDPSESSF